MHDIRALRADPGAFDAALARRGQQPVAAEVIALDDQRRAFQAELQTLQAERNGLAKQIGQAKRTGADVVALTERGAALRDRVQELEARAPALDAAVESALAVLPNVLDPDVPEGRDEAANVVVHQHGEPPRFNFAPRQHFELGEALGLMEFELAAKLSGSRFVVLRGALARLERALGQFMLDLHTTEHGYSETLVPVLVNDAAAYGTDKLPKFADDLFRTTDGRWLIPTAEVPLTATVMGDIVSGERLPFRMTALSECFRSEAGSAGRDTRGMLRQHQFRKVELVSVTTPDSSDSEHERMTRCAETVLERLGLPYRRMLLCAGDTGFGAAKTYDLEVWLPGQAAWREISSCSNTRAFQARRMNARYRPPAGEDGKAARPEYLHTLNGSGTAVGRALIAVMENGQDADGGISIPLPLRPYMGGLERIALP